MTRRDTLRAGLVFLEPVEFDLVDVASGLVRAIRGENYEVSDVAMVSGHEALIAANGQTLRLALYRPRPSGATAARDSFLHMPRIAAEGEGDFDFAQAILVLSAETPETANALVRGDARRLLAWSTYLMAEALASDFIHWRQPPEEFSVDLFLENLVQHQPRDPAPAADTQLRRDILNGIETALDTAQDSGQTTAPEAESLEKRGKQSRRRKAGDLPPLSDCEDALLDQAFADDMCVDAKVVCTKGPRDRMRLATWFLSLSIALFSLPLAGALFVIHLLRGENLRTASRTMAVLGLFMVASQAGMPIPGKGWLYF